MMFNGPPELHGDEVWTPLLDGGYLVESIDGGGFHHERTIPIEDA